MKLRDYQARLVDQVQSSRAPTRLVVLPTGGGKTGVAAELARLEPGRVLFVCPWRELVHQTVTLFRAAGIEAGAHMAGEPDPGRARVIVASAETLARRAMRGPWALVIIDEAHRYDTPRREGMIRALGGRAVVGLTATPWTTIGGPLRYDSLAVGPSPGELADRGYLRRPRVYRLPLEGVLSRARRGHWPRFVGFTDSVAESVKLAAELRESGISADHIDGATPGRARAHVMEGFAAGSLRGVTNCAVLIEGFDSTIDLVGLRRKMNLRLYVQACGRGVRPNGDAEAAIADPAGLSLLYGHPLDLPWPLWSRSWVPVVKRQVCRSCAEVSIVGAPHACRERYEAPPPAWIDRVWRDSGLSAVWRAEEELRRYGRPWLAGRSLVAAEVDAECIGRAFPGGWRALRLASLGFGGVQ